MNLNDLKPKTLFFIRILLGGTFFAQSVRAFSHQPDFLRLVSESPIFTFPLVSSWLTPDLFLTLVGVFDIIIALLLFAGIKPRTTALHGFVWICIVMANSLIIGRIIETADSIGYLGGLLALIIWDKDMIT